MKTVTKNGWEVSSLLVPIQEDPKQEAKYTGDAYIKHEQKKHKLHGIILVDTTKKLRDYGVSKR